MSKLSLVTGGTRGIGAAISLALKAAGYTVAASYGSNKEAAEAFAHEHGIQVFQWDVGKAEACIKGIKDVESALGSIEILVNNAGITRDGMLHRMKADQWLDVINTNLNSVFYMTQPLIAGMRNRGFGRIINIASVNGQKGQLGQANYSAAKAGVIGFTRALAQEGASKGITANVVAPGYIATEMVKAIPEKIIDSKILPTIPAGRLGEPDEVARCVTFLASDEAGFINGSTISINGGQYFS